MNTATTPLRRTAVACVVALAVALSGCATASHAPGAGESRVRVATRSVVTSAMHDALTRDAADRYVSELLVRARLATQQLAPTVEAALTPLHGR